jgi:hypothetical protein
LGQPDRRVTPGFNVSYFFLNPALYLSGRAGFQNYAGKRLSLSSLHLDQQSNYIKELLNWKRELVYRVKGTQFSSANPKFMNL